MWLHVSTVLLLISTTSEEVCKMSTETCRPHVPLCDEICSSTNETCTIRAVVILPNDTTHGSTLTLSTVLPVLQRAVNDSHEEGLIPEWLQVEFHPYDDQCSESYGQLAVIEAFGSGTAMCPHVVFGPICEYSVASVTRVMKFYGTPIIGPGGLSLDFERAKQKCEDDYFLFVRTSSMFLKGITAFFRSLILKYDWKKVVFLYEPEGQRETAGPRTCSFFMQSLVLTIMNIENLLYEDGDITLATMNLAEYMKAKIGVNNSVIIMCASYPTIRNILLTAESLGDMVYKGEYVFFNVELINQAEDPEKPWLDSKDSKSNITKLEQAYKSVITLTSKTDDPGKIHGQSKFLTDFYNSMYLYLHALSSFLKGPEMADNFKTKVNGYELVKTFLGNETKIEKSNETVEINCHATKNNEYSLLSYNSDKDKFEVVANYIDKTDEVYFLPGRKISWPGGKDTPPPDTPTCGYDNSKCPETSLPTYVYIAIGLVGIAILLVIIAIFLYRRHKLEAEIASMSWKVLWDDILDLQNTASRRDSMSSSSKRGSHVTFNSDLYSLVGDNQIYIPIGLYKNSKVAIKKLAPVKVDLTRKHLIRLKQMKDLNHEHLVKFIGASVDPPNCCILTEYCPKGSLQDILENDQFTLEWMIRISLIQDLVRGMTYLHQSEIKSHGNLSSTNCVVDSRFVLKITDFGLPFLKKHEIPNVDTYAFWRRQLWTAPELLRMLDPPVDGTQKADVYSFAIIVHEIVVRQGLFYLGEGIDQPPQDIVNSIKTYTTSEIHPPPRPYVDASSIDEEVSTLMQKCWNEDPMERPDFSGLKNLIKKLNKEHDNGNILDNLLSRMEQYANNLESLVEERTADYLEEKRKCEELLYQLLPKSVAAQLIKGQSVVAETFNQVTIYFSDIVGFTSLSAASTPLEVVDLLNDLYTCFDSILGNFDVYKVETIGDAYMVVSGLPVRNGNLHSREIARMSLALLAAVHKFQIRHRPGEKLKLRIGLHSGPCVAGVVGLKMPRFCLFGDTVNTASRMESNGEELKIHISPVTKEALDGFGSFEIAERGEVEMKGKGKMTTYWLNGEKVLEDSSNAKVQEVPPVTDRRGSAVSWNSNVPSDKVTVKIINEAKERPKFPKTIHPSKINNPSNSNKKSSQKSSSKTKVNFKANIKSQFNNTPNITAGKNDTYTTIK